MKILITGGFGYVGTKLATFLAKKGHQIFIIDNLLQKNLNKKILSKKIKFFRIDINNHQKVSKNLKDNDYDIVIHLAAIVGDPASKLFPDLTIKTNLVSSKHLFNLCKKNKIKKFFFFSTCSNYGLSDGKSLLNEMSPLKPLSIYAKTKVDFEKFLLKDKSKISKVILRISTLYGCSYRMRYDLTINEFTKYLSLKKKLSVFDADTWRPYIHLEDLSNIVNFLLNYKIKNNVEVYNTGIIGANYTKRDICDEIIKQIPNKSKYLSYSEKPSADKRNYKVDFSKITKLKIKNKYNLKRGIKEIIHDLKINKYHRKFIKKFSNI